MTGTNADALATWVGLAVVGAATLALVAAVPTAPPPDAATAADAIDAVAASPYPATATHPLAASAVSLGPHRLGLRTDGGTAWATFRRGPVTPAVTPGLRRVLDGEAPATAFATPAAFRTAAATARSADARWTAADRLRIRRVHWRGVRVTLVG